MTNRREGYQRDGALVTSIEHDVMFMCWIAGVYTRYVYNELVKWAWLVQMVKQTTWYRSVRAG